MEKEDWKTLKYHLLKIRKWEMTKKINSFYSFLFFSIAINTSPLGNEKGKNLEFFFRKFRAFLKQVEKEDWKTYLILLKKIENFEILYKALIWSAQNFALQPCWRVFVLPLICTYKQTYKAGYLFEGCYFGAIMGSAKIKVIQYLLVFEFAPPQILPFRKLERGK